MDLRKIDEAFTEMIMQPRIHHKLKMKAGAVMQLRYRVRKGEHIRIDSKIRMLQKAGVSLEHLRWTDKDIINAIQSVLKAGHSAKDFGAEYLFEKWRRQTLSFPSP